MFEKWLCVSYTGCMRLRRCDVLLRSRQTCLLQRRYTSKVTAELPAVSSRMSREDRLLVLSNLIGPFENQLASWPDMPIMRHALHIQGTGIVQLVAVQTTGPSYIHHLCLEWRYQLSARLQSSLAPQQSERMLLRLLISAI